MPITYTDNGGGAANGSDLEFTFTFPVLQTEDVKVALNGVTQATTKYAVDTASNPTKITFNNTNVDSSVQETSGAPKSGVLVRVYRQTTVGKSTGDDDPKAVYAAGSSIRAVDLNSNTEQALYAIHELQNNPVLAEQIDTGAITSDKILDGTIATADIANDSITEAKIANDALTGNNMAAGTITTAKIADDAITSAKIADDSINSEHYVDGSIDTAHIADDAITQAKIANDALTGSNMAAGTITTAKLADGLISTVKIANNAVTTAKIADANVTSTKLATGAVTVGKLDQNSVRTVDIIDANVTAAKLATGAVTTAKLDNNAVTTAKIADANITAAKIATNAVTTDKIADGELTTLAGMQSTTASNLASSTALTATTAELNQLDGITLETSVTTNSDTRIPTSKAVNDLVLSVTNALGGFVAIANETSFPTANPDPSNNAGTVVSISQLSTGLAVNSSGVATIANGAGTGNTVTITGFPSNLQSQTLPASSGLQVQTTSTLHTYTFHKQLASAADIQAISATVNSFSNRYRVSASAPTSSLDGGDLWYDTTNSKLMVYSSQNSAWEESSAIGNFFISTISSSSNTGGGSATANGTAYRFTISNAPTDAQQLLVSVDGVIQKPNAGSSQPSEGFVLVGNDIIFGSPPANGASMFVTVIGSTVGIGTPSDNTVTTAKLQNGSVTTAKIVDANVTTAKITDANVTTAKIADDAVTAAKLADTSVTAGSYGSSSAIPSITVDAQGRITAASTSSIDSTSIANGTSNVSVAVNGNTTVQRSSVTRFTVNHTGVDVAGNITVSGTVDGVDIAALNTTVGNISTDLVNDTSPQLGGNLDCNGNDITGNGNIDFPDNSKIKLGTSDDLQIFHNGHNIINGAAGQNLEIQTNAFRVRNQADSESMIVADADGAVELYYDNSKKFDTVSSGVEIHGNLQMDDNGVAKFGTGGDLEIFHDGANSYIRDQGVGDLIIRGDVIRLKSPSNESMLTAIQNSGLTFYYDNETRFQTTADGAILTGPGNYTTLLLERSSGTDSGKVQGWSSGDSREIGFAHPDSANWFLRCDKNTNSGGTAAIFFTTVYPSANNNYDLGTSSNRWRNIYTNDLNLSNKGSSNEMDGTWGDWTIQEGESDLFLKNNRSGKKYKFNLTEVS